MGRSTFKQFFFDPPLNADVATFRQVNFRCALGCVASANRLRNSFPKRQSPRNVSNFKGFALILLFLFMGLNAFGQTKMIAHKSHSGSVETFTTKGAHNVGIVEMLDSVIKLTDTSALFIMKPFRSCDTVYNHPFLSDPNISLDSLKHYYFAGTTLVGFEISSSSMKQSSQKRKDKRKDRKAKKRKDKKRSAFPFVLPINPPNSGLFYLFLLSSLVGVLSFVFLWRNYKRETV